MPKPKWRGEYLPHGAGGMRVAPGLGALFTPATDFTKYGFTSYQQMASYCGGLNPATYLLHDACWGYSPSAWQQIASLAPPPAPPAPSAVDAGTSKVPAPYQCANGSMETAATNCPEYIAAIDAVIAQQAAAQKAGAQQFFSELPDNPVPPPSDCGFFGNIAAAADGSLTCVNNWANIGLAVVAVLAGMLLLRGVGR